MSERNEWERDAVVWLAGRRLGEREDDRPQPHPGFEAWRAADDREGAAARFVERVRAALGTIARGVRRIDRWPEAIQEDGAGAAPLIELGVAAGTGRELLEEPCDAWVALPSDLRGARHVALRVVGDSMTPLLHSGDVVLVDLDGSVAPGAVVVARHPEHGYVVKRAGRARPWGLPLESLNPAYPTIVLPSTSGAPIGPVVLRWCGHGPPKPRLAPAS
jgi:SOS-response transcriptional repressor LexA